jgi:hypothetical protein
VTWVFTVVSLMNSSCPISAFESPVVIRRKTSGSRPARVGEPGCHHPAELRVAHQVAAVEIPDGDDRRRVVDDRAHSPLAGSEGALHLRAIRHVVTDAYQRLHHSVPARDRRALREQDPLLAVGGAGDPLLEDERLPRLDGVRDVGPHALAIGRKVTLVASTTPSDA